MVFSENLFADFFLYYLQLLIFILIAVAFLTLLERKVLRYSQLRKGPNKVGIIGVLQPFSDALKLFSKEDRSPNFSNSLIFWMAPLGGFIITVLVWVSTPSLRGFVDIKYGVLFFLCCVRFRVYGIILSGWAANSKYSLLGGLRAVAQTISYEIILAFILLSLVFFTGSLSFNMFMVQQNNSSFLWCSFPLFLIFFFSCVVETNRAPFDLAEGESELVSGFNVEYGGLKFALIFMAEYARIFWMRVLVSFMFLGGKIFLILNFCVFFFILLRSSFPRVRYDILMAVTWKKLLPVVLILFVVALCV